MKERTYLPAAGFDWALPFYDSFTWVIGGDAARRALIEQAALEAGQEVLDLGCGTGTLVVLVKRLHPDVVVTGLDPDPRALERAERKAARAGLMVRFDRGFSDELPYPEASFDRVFSSFMFHHLEAESKAKTFAEVRRVLRPGGSLHLVDFGGHRPGSSGFLAHLLHSTDRLKDNFEERIPALMSQAGLRDVGEVGRRSMAFGLMPIAYYHASRDEMTERQPFRSSQAGHSR